MNFQHFEYPPPPTGGGPNSSSKRLQPLRVTTDGVEPLLFALVHTIEFCLAIGRKDAPLPVFTPRIVTSNVLGGVAYTACESHSASLIEGLNKAVTAAKQLSMHAVSNSQQAVSFRLRVRISRNVVTKSLLSFLSSSQKHVIAVWEFLIIKTKSEVTQQVGMTNSSFHPSQHQLTSPIDEEPAAMPSGAGSSESRMMAYTVYSNDPLEVRNALQYIIRHVFASIDAEWYKDVRAGDLIYEVDTLEKK